jgi:hypothetical protein
MDINFGKLLDDVIAKEIEARKTRERSGKFSPSRMGRCYRYQYWSRANEPETNPIPPEVYRKFRAGNIYHRDLQSLVDNVEVKFENDSFVMFADHVVDDCVVDFKTVFSTQFRAMKKQSPAEIAEDKGQYVMQLMTYCHFLGKPRGILVFVNKDDYDILQVPLEYAKYSGIVRDEIEILLGYWGQKKLPPPSPRCYVSKGKSRECEYCVFSIDGKCKQP